MNVTDWLLDGDPAIRWQVRRDLLDGTDGEVSSEEVAAARALVADDGWGAELLALQDERGYWGGTEYGPHRERDSVMWTLQILRNFGIDPADARVRAATERVRDGVVWSEFDDRPYFHGEDEACVNGGVLANAAYFGRLDDGADGILERLLAEQLADGGWNCEPDSERSSFDSTLCVLEGLLGYERATERGDAGTDDSRFDAVRAARLRGEEYLLERALYLRRSNGEVVKPRYLDSAFPTYWFYDVLRALDYFWAVGGEPDERLVNAVALLLQQRDDDGRWLAGEPHPGIRAYELDAPAGEPSRWNTLRALRLLRWAAPVLEPSESTHPSELKRSRS